MSWVVPILPLTKCRETHDLVSPDTTVIRLSGAGVGGVIGLDTGRYTSGVAAAGVGAFGLIPHIMSQPLPDID